MIRFFARLVIVLLAILPVSTLADSTPSVLAYELRSLDEPARHKLARYEGKPVLVTFFQPDCNWCAKQIRGINHLVEKCPGEFHALAVGVNGDRQRLKKEIRRLKPAFPAYEASPQLIADVGGEVVTPFTLVGDRDGRFKNWLVGLMSDEKLMQQLGGSIDGTCR